MASKEFKVVCGQGVADVLKEVDRMITAAYEWIGTPDCQRVYNVEMTRALWNELHDRVTAMELSWLRSLKQLIAFGELTGEIRLSWDSDHSLLAVQSGTGFTIGLVPHYYYVNGERTPICTWSLNS